MTPDQYNNILYPDLIVKLKGHREKTLVDIKIQRQVAWAAYTAPHLNPKKLPKTIDEFWRVDEVKDRDMKKITDEKRAAVKLALQQDKDGKIKH